MSNYCKYLDKVLSSLVFYLIYAIKKKIGKIEEHVYNLFVAEIKHNFLCTDRANRKVTSKEIS